MLIDMHNHTTVASPCSALTPVELIETARTLGLDAICVTDHQWIKGANAAQRTGQRLGFPVFRGVEARTDLGDMLLYGYYEDVPEDIALESLCPTVHRAGGLIFAAHPFHLSGGWNLYSAFRHRGRDLAREWDKIPILRELDGIEVINGGASVQANAHARDLADRLGIPGIGGSDAHHLEGIGLAATEFPEPITSDEELLAALRRGRFEAVYRENALVLSAED